MYIFGLGTVLDGWIATIDNNPWSAHAGYSATGRAAKPSKDVSLYTPEQRERRDRSRWTLAQGILAPLQFLAFAVSVYLVFQYLMTGQGLALATASIVIKTMLLYAIMVTGSLWERDVFGRYLFARAFFWEDAVSMVVIALHTAYLVVLITGAFGATAQMYIALAAYATYLVNLVQFLFKFRMARREDPVSGRAAGLSPMVGAAE